MKTTTIGAIIIIIVTVACFTYAYINFFYKAYETTSFDSTETPALNDDLDKLKIEQSIIEGFESKKEMITYETLLSEVITWDESWGQIGLFHKSQKIKFYGTGIYTCDLEKIDANDIWVDFDSMHIEITVPKPEIRSITIDETKTEYEDVNKGWLRFGYIKLTPVQYDAMYTSVKESMETQLADNNVYNKAENATVTAVKEIFTELLKSVEGDFTVLVKIKR